jgi:uncharacterized protein YcnI
MAVLRRLGSAAVSCTLLASAAQAHVSADPREAAAGGYQAVRFRVGHGCHETAATTALRIQMPPGLQAARPQPKPGWTLSIEHGPGGAVTAVVWRGLLPADQFDEFAVLMHLPDAAGPLYFPTTQTCGAETEQWTQIPSPDGGPRPSRPAPALRLTPASPPQGGHQH